MSANQEMVSELDLEAFSRAKARARLLEALDRAMTPTTRYVNTNTRLASLNTQFGIKWARATESVLAADPRVRTNVVRTTTPVKNNQADDITPRELARKRLLHSLDRAMTPTTASITPNSRLTSLKTRFGVRWLRAIVYS